MLWIKISDNTAVLNTIRILVAHECNPSIGGQEQGMVRGLLGLLSLLEQWLSDRTLANFKLAMGSMGSCSLRYVQLGAGRPVHGTLL